MLPSNGTLISFSLVWASVRLHTCHICHRPHKNKRPELNKQRVLPNHHRLLIKSNDLKRRIKWNTCVKRQQNNDSDLSQPNHHRLLIKSNDLKRRIKWNTCVKKAATEQTPLRFSTSQCVPRHHHYGRSSALPLNSLPTFSCKFKTDERILQHVANKGCCRS